MSYCSRFLVSALTLLVVLVANSLYAHAQEAGSALTVTVRDADGVIPRASVTVTPAGGGRAVRSTTDASGVARFATLPPGIYDVAVEFPGFAAAHERGVVLRGGEPRTVELVLAPAGFSTEVTVTTANRREQLLLEVAEPTTLFDRAMIEDTGGRSVKDVLVEQAGSGVQVNAGGGQGYISINGIPNSGVLVLVNGRRYLGRDANGNLNLEDLQLAGVERIEVVKGAGSALYGSDALGGVVNIITTRADQPGAENSVTFTGGSYGDVRVADTFSYRGTKGGVSGTAGYRTYDGFDLQADSPQTIGQPASVWWNGNATADYQITGKVVARLFADYQDRDIDPYYFAGATQLASSVYNSVRDLTRSTIAPEIEFTPAPNTSFVAQYTHSRYDRDETRIFVENGSISPQAPWRERMQEAKLTGRRDWGFGGKRHPLQGGYEFRRERLTRGTLAPTTAENPFGLDNRSRDIHVVWAQQEATVGSLTLTGGVRYDEYSDFGGAWSPKASARYALGREHGLRASYGRGFRPPYFNELFLNTPPFFVGNPDLRPEYANTLSAGYAYGSARAQLTADYFLNRVRDGIVFDLTAQPFTYANLNRYESTGVNLAGAVTLPRGFTPSASYTYNRRENQAGAEIGGYPKHAGFLKLLWQEPRLGLRANIRAQFNGTVPPGATDPSYQDAYQVWYGQVAKTFTLAGGTSLELFAQVDNIFDEGDLYRRQSCPAGAAPTCQPGAPVNGANDLLQIWIAPRTFLAGVTIGMDWTR